MVAQARVLGHEDMADRVVARIRQLDAEPGGLLLHEGVGNLHQDAGAVPGDRVGADRSAVLEIFEDAQRILDQLVRGAALEIGDKADAAGVVFAPRIIEPTRPLPCRRPPGAADLPVS